MSTRTAARYVVDTPPWCDTVECFVHGDGREHHVEGCYMAATVAAAEHRLSHAMDNARRTVELAVTPLLPDLPYRARLAYRLAMRPPRWMPRRVRSWLGDRLASSLVEALESEC